jgi:hypothetical protein
VWQNRRPDETLIEMALPEDLGEPPAAARQPEGAMQRRTPQIEVHQQHLLAQLARQRDGQAGGGRGLAFPPGRAGHQQRVWELTSTHARQLEVDAPELESERALHLEPVQHAMLALRARAARRAYERHGTSSLDFELGHPRYRA